MFAVCSLVNGESGPTCISFWLTSGNCELCEVDCRRVCNVFDGSPRIMALFSDRFLLRAIWRGSDGCCLSRPSTNTRRPCTSHWPGSLLSSLGVFSCWREMVDGLLQAGRPTRDDSGFGSAASGRPGVLADWSTTVRTDDMTGRSICKFSSSRSLLTRFIARPRSIGSMIIASSRCACLSTAVLGLTAGRTSDRGSRSSAGKDLRRRRQRRPRVGSGVEGGAGGGSGWCVICSVRVDRVSRMSSIFGGFATEI